MSVIRFGRGITRGTPAVLAFLTFHIATAAPQVVPPPQLKIKIIKGEGAINYLGRGMAAEAIIQVEDENDRPFAGAIVTFSFPDSGAGGVFASGDRTLMIPTDVKGQARVTFRPSGEGKVQLRANASHRGQTAQRTITQTNQPGAPPGGGGAKWIALVGAAGGAAAGAVLATRKKESTPQQPQIPRATVSIGPGQPSVGAPR